MGDNDDQNVQIGQSQDEERLFEEVAKFIENLREQYPDGYVIGNSMILVDVLLKDEDGDLETPIHYRSSDSRPWVMKAFIAEASDQAEKGIEQGIGVKDEEEEE